MSHATIHHGVDLCDVDTLRDVMTRHDAFAERVFTPDERAYCERYPDPVPHYAARFAAKEATLKALGIGLTPFGVDRALQDIELVRRGRAPALRLAGRPARAARALGVFSRAVSISHEGERALASVVMLAEAPE
ncbi:MAG: holo-ACP synthase [Planctomycetota bacterium]|nr:holo-ACP synthase [Planctomycetota bacterium]